MGIAVIRWAAAEDITDEHVLTFEVALRNNIVKPFTGLSDEGYALLIFVSTGGFADEDNIGIGMSYPVRLPNLPLSTRRAIRLSYRDVYHISLSYMP